MRVSTHNENVYVVDDEMFAHCLYFYGDAYGWEYYYEYNGN